MTYVERLFRKHGATTVRTPSPLEVSKRHFLYALVHLDLDPVPNEARYIGHTERLFRLIKGSGGDLDQFLGGVILVTFGLEDPDKSAGLVETARQLSKVDSPVSVIIGEDDGLVGAFGFDERIECTAVGPNVRKDLQRIHGVAPGVGVHKSLIAKIPALEGIAAWTI